MKTPASDQWCRRIAVWLPRLADPPSQNKATESLMAIAMALYKSTDAAAESASSSRHAEHSEFEEYRRAISLLDDQIDQLIPRWIEQLIALHHAAQRNTDARIAAMRNDGQMPEFSLGPILAAGKLTVALQACGDRIDAHLAPLSDALNTIGRDGDDEVADAMSHAGPAIVSAKAGLFQLLRSHGIWSSRSGIRAAMARLARFDESTIAAVKAMLHDADAKVRQAATAVLGSIGEASREATDDLLAMESFDINDRCSAIYALAAQQPPAPAVLEMLERALHDRNGHVRLAAVSTIGKVRADPTRFIPQLIAASDDTEPLHDDSIAETVVWALRDYGPAAVASLPRLRAFLDGPIAGRTVKPKWVREAIASIAEVPLRQADDAIGIMPLKPRLRSAEMLPQDEPIFPVTFRDRLCYIDSAGSIVLKTDFEYGGPFHADRAIVHSNRKTFVIDRTGHVVFESKWRYIKPYHEGLAAIKVKDQWGFVDRDGNVVIEPHYSSVTRFSQGLAGAELGRSVIALGHGVTMDRPGSRGFIDRTGKVIVPLVYLDVQPFSEDRATVCLGFVMKPNPLADDLELPTDRKYGLMDQSGKLVLDGTYSGISPFSEGLAAVWNGRLLRDRHGYIDTSGNVFLPLQFTSAGNFKDRVAMVKRRGRLRRHVSELIDHQGRTVFETTKTLEWAGFCEGLAGAYSEGNWGMIDLAGQIVVAPQFDDVGPFRYGIAPVTRGEWNGFIDRSGKFIWGPTTESIYFDRTIESEWY